MLLTINVTSCVLKAMAKTEYLNIMHSTRLEWIA